MVFMCTVEELKNIEYMNSLFITNIYIPVEAYPENSIIIASSPKSSAPGKPQVCQKARSPCPTSRTGQIHIGADSP